MLRGLILLCPPLGGKLLPWGPILAWGMCPTEMESQSSPGPRNCLGCKTLPQPDLPLIRGLSPYGFRHQDPDSQASLVGCPHRGYPPLDLGLSLSAPPRCLCPLCRRHVAQVGSTVAGQPFRERIPGLSTSNHYPNLKTSDLRLREANK